jgi:hypothetical protein
VDNDLLFNWDLSNLRNQIITLHLYMTGRDGYAERFVHFSLAVPTPTPTPTITPSPTQTPTVTATVPTATPSATAMPTLTPSGTPTP